MTLLLLASTSAGAVPAPPAGEPPGKPFSVAGLSAEAAGVAIFSEADRRDSGYADLEVDLTMVLRNSKGAEARRSLRIRQLEMAGEGDRLLVVFDSPKPIRGTALLSYAYKTRPDDQWLYLPALKRVKRITSQNRSGPFLGSEFAYEDLALTEVEKYDYRLIRTEQIDGASYYVVERIPLDEFSGYSRQVVYLDCEAFRIHRIDFYDRRDRPLKALVLEGFQQHSGRFWRAERMLMTNQQTGRSTELTWHNFRFGIGLDADRDFSTNSLRRVR